MHKSNHKMKKGILKIMTNEELILQYKKLAYKMAIPFCKGFPKSADDIKSAALEGLCRGVKDVVENKKFDYAGAIIYLNIRRTIFDEVSNIPLIPIPTSLIKKKRLACYTNKVPFKISDLYPEVFNDPDQNLISQIGSDGFRHVKHQEILEWLGLDEDELKVLNFRLEEQTIREIAIEMSCSKSNVHNIVGRIRAKWQKKS